MKPLPTYFNAYAQQAIKRALQDNKISSEGALHKLGMKLHYVDELSPNWSNMIWMKWINDDFTSLFDSEFKYPASGLCQEDAFDEKPVYCSEGIHLLPTNSCFNPSPTSESKPFRLLLCTIPLLTKEGKRNQLVVSGWDEAVRTKCIQVVGSKLIPCFFGNLHEEFFCAIKKSLQVMSEEDATRETKVSNVLYTKLLTLLAIFQKIQGNCDAMWKPTEFNPVKNSALFQMSAHQQLVTESFMRIIAPQKVACHSFLNGSYQSIMETLTESYSQSILQKNEVQSYLILSATDLMIKNLDKYSDEGVDRYL